MVKQLTKLEETMNKLIESLLVNGQSHMYPLHEGKSGKSIGPASTVHHAKNALLKNDLIKLVDTEKRHDGPITKIYGLTLSGLLYGFNKDVFNAPHIRYIVIRFKEVVPLVFGEWDYFKKEEVLEIAEKHLIDTLKYCGREYKRFLEELKEISENERFFDWRRERQEKWKKERTWAELITKTFLYSSFHYNPKVDRYRGHRSILSLEEQKTLQEVIQKNEELQDYCLLCAREEAYSNTLKSSRFIMLDSNRNLLWDKDTVQTKISNIMFGKRGPIQKIAKLAIAEDWFSAAFELCQLYKTYMFNSETEAVQTVSRFLGELATLKYNAPINPLNPKESYDNLTKEQKERLKICSVEITAALFFFGFRQVKVWDKTYSQFKPKVDMLKDLKKNRERTIEIIKKDIREVLRKRWQN